MKKILFNDKYGLTRAVLEGRKTQTRRIAYIGNISNLDCGICVERKNFGRATLFYGIVNIAHSRYCVGEEVAVAQAYCELVSKVGFNESEINKLRNSKGWTNKMFVRADLMPNRIRITNIRIERLQDISEEDCLAEGIWEAHNIGLKGVTYWYTSLANSPYRTAKKAYAALIDKISGKGTWDSDPYVFVYEFELINHPLWD